MRVFRRTILVACFPIAIGAMAPGAIAHEPLDRQLRLLDRLVAAHPGDAELHLRRGELHRIGRQWRSAEADYARARELDPSLDAVDLCSGRMRLEAGEPDRAVEHLEAYLVRRPGDAEGLELRGRAREMLGHLGPAAADYDSAIARRAQDGNPGSPDLYLSRSRALARSAPERIDEAIRGLDEGIALLGGPVSLQLEALGLEERSGRTDPALRRLDRIASLAGRREVWLARRGDILAKAGREEEAVAAYREALAELERLPDGRRSRGAFRKVETHIRTAISDLSRTEARP